MPRKVSLAQSFAAFADTWSPKLVAELNGQHVRLAKVEGSFVWHRHEEEDELFLVVDGRLRIDLRDDDGVESQTWLEPGELLVVPRGVEHRPHADSLTSILLFEPASTVNTGTAGGERTVEPERL